MTAFGSNIDEAGSVTELYAEGLRYFMGQGKLNNTLKQVTDALKEHRIDYMVIGAVALMAHGYPRFTEDVDLVLTSEGLEAFHRELVGVGYIPAFPGAKRRFRSVADGGSIEILTTGEYPGDGKPKPVRIPDPSTASVDIDGLRVVAFPKLIELKLASGMTAPHRLKDLADVQEMIKIHHLQSSFAEQLEPFVREKFLELLTTVEDHHDEVR
jgi:hypothetical protein